MSESEQTLPADLPPSPGARILRREDAACWMEGYRFLERSKEAYEAEYARGYADGKAAGAAEASTVVTQTAIDAGRYVQSLQTEIAGLAVNIVRKVLGEFDCAELVTRATVHALSAFRYEKALTVTVHPKMANRVHEALAPLAGRLGFEFAYQVESNPALALDACVVATEFAVLDASIDAQLNAISKALTAAAQTRASQPGQATNAM
jgi:type III secretion protein L